MQPDPRLSTAPARTDGGASSLSAAALVLVGATLLVLLGGVLSLLVRSAGSSLPGREVLRLAGSLLLLLGLGLSAPALGWLVFAPVRAGRAAAGIGRHRVMLPVTAFAVLLAILLGNVLHLALVRFGGPQDAHSLGGFLLAAATVHGTLLGVAYFRFFRPGVLSFNALGLDRNRLAARLWGLVGPAHVLSGVAGWLALLAVSFMIQFILRGLGIQQNQLADYTWVRGLPPTWFVLVVVIGAVLAPFVEELFFRAVIFGGYLPASGAPTAYVSSALLFGLLHLNAQAFLPLVAMGLVLAWLYRSTDSLAPGVVAHGLNNGLAFFAVYFGLAGPGS